MAPTWDVLVGDVLDGLRSLPDESVHCVVTSPPYWGLRDYGAEGMIGLEPTLAEHMTKMVEVFAEVRRVLRSDGTLWLNYGDAYSHGTSSERKPSTTTDVGGWSPGRCQGLRNAGDGLAPKQRLMLPARVALALQDSGWWVRSEIVWAKGVSFCPTYSGSCMPSSVRDRPTDSHEMLYLLSKAPRYFYDGDAVREEPVMRPQRRSSRHGRSAEGRPPGHPPDAGLESLVRAEPGVDANPAGRNVRTVWTINPRGFAEAHFATYPEALVEPCVKAGTSEHGCCTECGAPWRRIVKASGTAMSETWSQYRRTTLGWEPTCDHADAPRVPCTVLDPFNGSGTTGAVAIRLGRSYVGIELNPDYAEMSRKRIGRAAAEAGQGGDVPVSEDPVRAQFGLFGETA